MSAFLIHSVRVHPGMARWLAVCLSMGVGASDLLAVQSNDYTPPGRVRAAIETLLDAYSRRDWETYLRLLDPDYFTATNQTSDDLKAKLEAETTDGSKPTLSLRGIVLNMDKADKSANGIAYVRRKFYPEITLPDGKTRRELRHNYFEIAFTAETDVARWRLTKIEQKPSEKAREVDFEETERLYNGILGRTDATPQDKAICYTNKGQFYLTVEEYKRAEEAARQAVALDPKLQTGYAVLAGALKGQKRYDEAIEQYRKADATAGSALKSGEAAEEIGFCEVLRKQDEEKK